MILLRTGEQQDLEGMLRLHVELHRFTALGAPARFQELSASDETRLREWLTGLLEDPAATCLVAIDDEELIGLAEVRIEEPGDLPGVVPTRRAHLHGLVVTASHRGSGIGERLLEAVETWVRDADVEELDLAHFVFEGDPSEFYERLGYRVVKRTMSRRVKT